MIIDNIKLIDGSIQNAVVESGSALPSADLTAGRIFYLTQNQGPNNIGLYIHSGSDWVLFSSSQYVDDRIAAIVGTAPETLDSLAELAAALGEDPEFILTINTKIDNEETRALAAESSLSTSLTTEINRALAAESVLQDNIDSEVATRTASDSNLQTQIDNEVTARSSADTSFQNQIDTEIDNRNAGLDTKVNKAGDTMTGFLTLHADPSAIMHPATKQYVDAAKQAVTTAVNAETSRATGVEGSLSNDIDNEVARATGVESALSSAIQDENTRATSAEGTLQSNIDAEVSERQNSDITLQSAINSEITRATGVEASLQTQLNAIDGNGGALDAEETARIAGDAALQSQITANLNAIDTEETDRIAGDAALQSQVDTINNTDFLRADVNDTMAGFLTLAKDPTADGHAAHKKYVDDTIDAVIAAAPGALDTLNELAAALGDDPNFATTITNQIAAEETDRIAADNTITSTLNSVQNTYSRRDTFSKSANYTLPGGQNQSNIQSVVFADTSGGSITVTLPASPEVGCIVTIMDAAGSFTANPVTISRNGSVIMGVADNMQVSQNFASVSLIFSGSANGWRVIY